MPSRSSCRSSAAARWMASRLRRPWGSRRPAVSVSAVVILVIVTVSRTARVGGAILVHAADGAHQLRAGKVAGHQVPFGLPDPRQQGCRFGLRDDELRERRRVDVVGHPARTARPHACGGVRRIPQDPARGRRGGRAVPVATNCASRWAGIAVNCATGRLRSVIVTVSPASACATTADAFCFRARIPTVAMSFNVAPVLLAARALLRLASLARPQKPTVCVLQHSARFVPLSLTLRARCSAS